MRYRKKDESCFGTILFRDMAPLLRITISKQSELMSKNKKKKLTVNYILNFFFESAIMFQLNLDFFWKNFGWIITARKKILFEFLCWNFEASAESLFTKSTSQYRIEPKQQKDRKLQTVSSNFLVS